MQNYTPKNPFDAYLWAHGFDSNAAVGRHFAVTGEMVRKWRLALDDPDFTRPSQAKLQAIHTWTRGKVTPNHFFNLTAPQAVPAPAPDRCAASSTRGQTAAGGVSSASPAAHLAGGGS